MASGQKVKLNAASIPARPFVLFQPEDEEAIERVFSDWLDERIARAGFNG
jgi:phage gpG-like protein